MNIKYEARDVAIKAAFEAGEIIKSYFRTNRSSFNTKDAKSAIVTAADTEAETIMRTVIESKFPEHGIQGEEFETKIGNSAYKWVLDPIDGTSNFVMGKPIFGSLVSLFYNEEPILGVIYQPILDEMFIGMEGEGSYLNGHKIKASNTSSISDSFLTTNPPYMFETPYEQYVLNNLSKSARAVEFGGDCYNYAMLATGHIDICLVSGDDFHDFAAVIPVVKEAGGIITDWQGNDLTSKSSGHIIATSNEKLHENVLQRISELSLSMQQKGSAHQGTELRLL